MASPSRGPPVLASDWLSWPLPVTKTYSRPAGQVPRTPPHGNAMDRKLLDILVCPATRQPLSLLDKPGIAALNRAIRSEERRVGKGRVSTCGSRWAPSQKKKKKKQ